MSCIQVFLFIIQINIIYGDTFDCGHSGKGAPCLPGPVNCDTSDDCTVNCQGKEPSGVSGGCEDVTINGPGNAHNLFVNCYTAYADGEDPVDACKNAIINANEETDVEVQCIYNGPFGCPSMTIGGIINGDLKMYCSSCVGTSIDVTNVEVIDMECSTRGNACTDVSITGQAGTDIILTCDSDATQSEGTNHCANMNINAALSHELIIDANAGNRAANTLANSNITCPDSGICSINITNSHVSALQCVTLQAPGDIADINILNCNGVQCFDDSDTCGTNVQFINTITNQACFITNSDATWTKFECLPSNTQTAMPSKTPTAIATAMPSKTPTAIATAMPSNTQTAMPSKTPTPCPEGAEEIRNIRAVLNAETKEECVNMKGGERTALVKSILEKTMNIAEPARLCISLEIIKVECGSFIVDYSLTTNDPDLMNKAVKNINDAVGTIGTIIIEEEIISFTIASNEELNPSNPNPSDSSDSVSDISSDSSDGIFQSGYNSLNNMEQSESVIHVGNNLLLEVNV
eukprot:9504_1